MSTDVQNLLQLFLFVSGCVTEFVEQVKKQLIVTLFKGATDLTPEQQSLLSALLLVTRFVAGVVGVLMLGGYQTMVGLVPFLTKVPEFGLLVLAGLAVGLGSGAIHIALDFFKGLGSWVSTPAPILLKAEKLRLPT